MDIKEVQKKDVWEDFIRKQAYSTHFQSWNWGEFEKSMGESFKRYGIYKGEKLIGLMPVKEVDAKRGKYLYLRHGPIFDFDDSEVWGEFRKFIKQLAESSSSWFVRMSPLIQKKEENKYREFLRNFNDSPMHDVDAEITWVLDLEKGEADILKGMRKNTRYYIKRAERDGVRIFKTRSVRYLADFWSIYRDTVKRQKWSAYTKTYIKKEFKAFLSDGQIELYFAKYKKKLIAASLIVHYMDQAIYHHSGSLTKYRNIPASYLLQWEAIRQAKKRNLKWYNFWGIAPIKMNGKDYEIKEDHPWKGLTFFKLGFGGEKREFMHAKDLPVSRKYYITKIFETLEKKKRGY